MRTHALGQPVRQASGLTHERGHASPQIVNRECLEYRITTFVYFSLFFRRLLPVWPGLHGSPREERLMIAGARCFTGHMSVMSPNQQCQSTDGKSLGSMRNKTRKS